jgi:hypothetical protein
MLRSVFVSSVLAGALALMLAPTSARVNQASPAGQVKAAAVEQPACHMARAVKVSFQEERPARPCARAENAKRLNAVACSCHRGDCDEEGRRPPAKGGRGTGNGQCASWCWEDWCYCVIATLDAMRPSVCACHSA